MANFGLLSEAGKQIPLKSVAVSGHINGYLFGLETKFTYQNTSGNPLEVVFRFPVDESSAVVGLEAKIDGRKIKGEVKEKEEARQIYDDALSSGLSAALGEEKTGDIFSLTLGNLPPNGDAEITLKLSGEMPLDNEVEAAARFCLPSVLKQRYTPEGSSDPLMDIGGELGQVVKGSAPAVSSLQLTIDRANDISSITSPSHSIKSHPNDRGMVEVTIADSSLLAKDIVILIQYKYCHTPRAIVEKGEAHENELKSNPAVMLEFFPKFKSLQVACEFVFVVDRSGSMSGRYINSAKETLILFLKSIPPGCYFNIIGFGSYYETLFPDSVPYNQTNLDKAMKHAQSLQANLGGTELLRPLEFIFGKKLASSGLPRQVFVLTDGSVSNTTACIDLTRKNAHVARVFTFGIGSGASSALVKGLARAGNGSAEFIEEGERMQGKVISSLKKALQPSVADLQLKFSVPDGVDVLQAPSKIPPVFNGEKLLLYGWLKGGKGKSGQCTAVLKGKLLGSDVEHHIDFSLEEEDLTLMYNGYIVHQLAAKNLIQDWESEKDKKKAAIIKLSIESSVVSSLTSYIAVDEDQQKPIEGAIKVYDLTAESAELFSSYSYGIGGGIGYSMASSGAPVRRNTESRPSPRAFFSRRMTMESLPAISMSTGSPPSEWSSDCQCQHRTDIFAKSSISSAACLSFIPPPSTDNKDERFMDVLSFDDHPGRTPSPSQQSFSFAAQSKNTAVADDLFGDFSGSSFTNQSRRDIPDSYLSHLVTLQSAEGYWKLDDSLASIIGQSLSDLKSSSPSGCSDVVWGTVLALALLETKYSSQKDEWELLAFKSSTWIQGQPLPSGVTVDSLMQQAKQALK